MFNNISVNKTMSKTSLTDLKEILDQLDADRTFLLRELDSGRWPELRLDLAALERELGQLLTRLYEKQEKLH